MSDSADDIDPAVARINSLLQFETELLKCRDLIDIALDELRSTDYIPTQEHLVEAVKNAVSHKIEQANRENTVYALLNTVMNSGHPEILNDQNADEDFIEYILLLVQKYNQFVQAVWLRTHQGKKFWWSVNTEYVRRSETSEIGMNHSIEVNGGSDYEITVSPNSNLRLIDNLLQKQNTVMEDLSEQEMRRLEEQRIEDIQSTLDDIRDKI